MSIIDIIGQIRRMMNKNATETFDPGTDSLEAIADALAAMGIGPQVGIDMFGVCDPAMVASTTEVYTNNLAGLKDDLFNDEFYMQVILNANAPGAAPEGEIRRITNFVAATQHFTTDAFSANVEANDLLLILHGALVTQEIVDGVWVNSSTGVGGTNWPIGTPGMPVDNLADAFTIAAARGLWKMYIFNFVNLPSNIPSGMKFIGHGTDVDEVGFNNKSATGGSFTKCYLAGVDAGNADIYCDNCDIQFATTSLWAYNCRIRDAVTIKMSSAVFNSQFINCTLTFANNQLSDLIHVSGDLILHMTGAGINVNIYGRGLKLTIDNSCTAGTITIYGDVNVTDNSAGATIVDYSKPAIPRAQATFVYNEASALEQQLIAITVTEARLELGSIWLDMANVTQDTTIRVYHEIDRANSRLVESHQWLVADSDGVLIPGFTARGDLRITLQCGGAGVGNVNVPYAIV